MNDTTKTTLNIEEFEEKTSLLPEEVKRFLYKGEFKTITDKITKLFSLTDEQSKVLENNLFVTIVGERTKDSLIQMCDLFNFSQEQKNKFVSLCEEEIFQHLFDLTNYEVIDEVSGLQAPSPLEALSSIKDRLSQNSVVTPITRDYSIEKSQVPKNTPPPVIDPYRELPQ